MSVVVAWLIKTLGITGCALLAFYVYEEGIPGAYKIAFPESWPVVGGFGLVSIPVIGDLTTGRVHSFAADQVKIATAKQTAVCDGKLEKTVSTFEYDALAAQVTKEAQLRSAAEQANTEASKRAVAAQLAGDQANANIERLKAEAMSDKTLPSPTEEELKWLATH